jgi:hypothetical protein
MCSHLFFDSDALDICPEQLDVRPENFTQGHAVGFKENKQNWDNCSMQDIADAWDVSTEQVKMDLLSGRKLPDNIRGLALNDNETIIFQKRVDDDLKGQEDEFISNNNP